MFLSGITIQWLSVVAVIRQVLEDCAPRRVSLSSFSAAFLVRSSYIVLIPVLGIQLGLHFVVPAEHLATEIDKHLIDVCWSSTVSLNARGGDSDRRLILRVLALAS